MSLTFEIDQEVIDSCKWLKPYIREIPNKIELFPVGVIYECEINDIKFMLGRGLGFIVQINVLKTHSTASFEKCLKKLESKIIRRLDRQVRFWHFRRYTHDCPFREYPLFQLVEFNTIKPKSNCREITWKGYSIALYGDSYEIFYMDDSVFKSEAEWDKQFSDIIERFFGDAPAEFYYTDVPRIKSARSAELEYHHSG